MMSQLTRFSFILDPLGRHFWFCLFNCQRSWLDLIVSLGVCFSISLEGRCGGTVKEKNDHGFQFFDKTPDTWPSGQAPALWRCWSEHSFYPWDVQRSVISLWLNQARKCMQISTEIMIP